jgi:hypothetical protein
MKPLVLASRAARLDSLGERIASLHAQLRARSVYRAAAIYGGAAAGAIQVGDVLAHTLHLPPGTTLFLVMGSIAGFPLVVVGSWVWDVRI